MSFSTGRYVMYFSHMDLSHISETNYNGSYRFISWTLNGCMFVFFFFFFPFYVLKSMSNLVLMILICHHFFFSYSYDVSDSIDDTSSFSSIMNYFLESFLNYFEWDELKIFSLFDDLLTDFEKMISEFVRIISFFVFFVIHREFCGVILWR